VEIIPATSNHLETTRYRLLLTEISQHQSVRAGKVEWLGKSEHSPDDRVICTPGSRPAPPSRLPSPSPSAPTLADIKSLTASSLHFSSFTLLGAWQEWHVTSKVMLNKYQSFAF